MGQENIVGKVVQVGGAVVSGFAAFYATANPKLGLAVGLATYRMLEVEESLTERRDAMMSNPAEPTASLPVVYGTGKVGIAYSDIRLVEE